MTTIRAEYLEVDAFSLSTYGWETVDLSPLWLPAKKRGSDRRIPGASGVRRYPRRRDVTVRSLRMVIVGHVNADGVRYADAREGLDANLAIIEAAIIDPPATADGTRTAVLHKPSGATKTGPVHVLGLEGGTMGPTGLRVVLELSIPGGKLL